MRTIRALGAFSLLTILVAAGSVAQSAERSAMPHEAPGFVIWPKAQPPAGTSPKLQFGTYSWSLAHREKSGEVESHETRDIVMIVQSGKATLVVGNDIVDPTRPSPTELRGTAIRNGTQRVVEAGDVINMPAGVPHQFLIAPG